jgi:hypothetical protein
VNQIWRCFKELLLAQSFHREDHMAMWFLKRTPADLTGLFGDTSVFHRRDEPTAAIITKTRQHPTAIRHRSGF